MDPISRQPQIGSLFDGYTGGSFTGGWGEGYGSAGIARSVSAAAERYFDRAGGAANITRRLREIHNKIKAKAEIIVGEAEYADSFDMTFAGGKLFAKTKEAIMKAIQQMWKSSLRLKRENMAVFTDQGILVLPNEFTNKYGIDRVNDEDNAWASTDFLGEIINSDGTGVIWNETSLEIWGLMHTHPISRAEGGVEGHSQLRPNSWEYRYWDGKIGNIVLGFEGFYVAQPNQHKRSFRRGNRKDAYLYIFNKYNQ